MIINGNVELTAKEEEIRFLRMKLTEYKRNREILRKRMPEKYAIEQELVTLQIQVNWSQRHINLLRIHILGPFQLGQNHIGVKCDFDPVGMGQGCELGVRIFMEILDSKKAKTDFM